MFILIFEQLVKMAIILLLAFVCYKIKLVNQEGNRCISNLLLMIVNPLLIITAYQTEYDPELVKGLLISFAAAIASHFLWVIITNILFRESGGADYCIERYHAMYSNCGFMGIPLIGSVLGNNGVFYLTAYMVIFNLFSWTHGVILMQKKFSMQNIKEGALSPMFIASLIAVIFFLLQIRIPSVLLDSMNYIADMNTPLAMMVAGFSVAQSDLGEMIRKVRLYFVCFVKLLLAPICLLPFLWLLNLPETIAMTLLIAAGCPAATTGTMMAIRYKQNYTYSSEMFAMSTILSIITLPVIVLLGQYIL